ncbi:MAG: hypothetical protein GX025_07175 [Clostridiales bacterium]|nr:hypothetical protein [Clostridiales bacterium]
MGIVSPVFFVYTSLGSLIGVGGAALSSRRLGRDDHEGVSRLFSLSLALMLVVGLLVTVGALVFLEKLLDILGAQGEIRSAARDYCLYFIPGAITTMLLYIPLNFFRITGKPNIGVWMFGIMALGNICFSLVFLLVFDMGMGGIGLSAVLSNLAALLYSLHGFFKKDSYLRLVSFKSEIKTTGELLATGSPMALTNLFTVLRTLLYNRLLLSILGLGGLAVFTVLANVNTFALSILLGVSQTIIPLTGVFFGEKDYVSIRHVMGASLRWGLFLATAFGLALAVFWKSICHIFGLYDESLFQSAMFAIFMFALSMPFAMVTNLYQFHFMTIGVLWFSNLISACRCLILPLAASLFLSKVSPLAVWAGIPAGEALTVLLTLAVSYIYGKKRGLSRLLLLNEEDEKNSRSIAFSVKNDTDSIINASEKISEFSAVNKIDEKRAMFISLALEELLLSISQNAFEDHDEGYMDVRLLSGTDHVILRIRNGGREFDPISFYESNPDNMEESLGIKMVAASARDIKYTRTLGVNNLSVLI